MTRDRDRPLLNIATGSGVAIAGIGIGQALNYLVKLLLARQLGVSQFGVLNMAISAFSLAAVVAMWGLPKAVTRHTALYMGEGSDEKLRGAFFSALKIAVPAGLLAGLLFYLGQDFLAGTVFDEPRLLVILPVFAVAVPVYVLERLFLSVLRGSGRIGLFVASRDVARWGFILVSVLVLANFMPPLVAAAGAYLTGSALTAALSFVLVKRNVGVLFAGGPRTPMVGAMLVFSSPLLFSSMEATVKSNIDKFVLGAVWNSDAVGLLSGAMILSGMLAVPHQAVKFVFLPIFTRAIGSSDQGELRRLFSTSVRWTTAIVLPTVLAILAFPEPFLRIAVGAEYVPAAGALRILSLGILIRVALGLGGQIALGLGRTRLLMLEQFIAMVGSVTLVLLLVPSYGLIGAATAFTLTLALQKGTIMLLIYRSTGIHPFDWAQARYIACAVAAFAGYYLAVAPFVARMWPPVAGIPVLYLLFFVVLEIVGLEPDDQRVRSQLLERLSSR